MSDPKVFNSSMYGPIPLSFTGKHLLQKLRECIEDAVATGNTDAQLTHEGHALSKARGDLAKYMSQLEQDKAAAPAHPATEFVPGVYVDLARVPKGMQVKISNGVVTVSSERQARWLSPEAKAWFR